MKSWCSSKIKIYIQNQQSAGRRNNRAIKLQMSPGRENEFSYHKLRYDKKRIPLLQNIAWADSSESIIKLNKQLLCHRLLWRLYQFSSRPLNIASSQSGGYFGYNCYGDSWTIQPSLSLGKTPSDEGLFSEMSIRRPIVVTLVCTLK